MTFPLTYLRRRKETFELKRPLIDDAFFDGSTLLIDSRQQMEKLILEKRNRY